MGQQSHSQSHDRASRSYLSHLPEGHLSVLRDLFLEHNLDVQAGSDLCHPSLAAQKAVHCFCNLRENRK